MKSLILIFLTSILVNGEGNGTPLQSSCLENPMDGWAWWAAVQGSLRVGHDWGTSLSLFTFMHWRRKWQPTPVFLPGESQGQGAWWAAIYGVAQSRTRLKWQQQQQQQQTSEHSLGLVIQIEKLESKDKITKGEDSRKLLDTLLFNPFK